MTFVAALALAGPALAGNVVEVVDPSERLVSIEALVPVPKLGPRDQATVAVLSEVLTEDTETYGKQQWRDLAARAGEVVRCFEMPDHIEISMDLLPEDAKTGLTMLAAIVRRAKLPQDAIDQAAQTLTMRHHGYWLGALRPEKLDYLRVRRADVLEMYHRLFTSATVTIAVGGPVQPGWAQQSWDAQISDWAPSRHAPIVEDHAAPQLFERLDVPVSVVEIRGPEFRASDAAFSTRLLALIGLGIGKGGSLFRVVREKHGWSYMQDAALWGTPDGFVPRLLVAQTGSEDLDARAKEIRTDLVEDVKGWTAADLERAKGMAEAIILRGSDVNPFYWRSGQLPITGSIQDRTFLAGYWTIKTGAPWNSSRMVGSMRQVSLDDFRQAAGDLLGASIAHVYHGR